MSIDVIALVVSASFAVLGIGFAAQQCWVMAQPKPSIYTRIGVGCALFAMGVILFLICNLIKYPPHF